MTDFASDDIYGGYNNFQSFSSGVGSGMSQTYGSFGSSRSSQYASVHKSPSPAKSSWRGRGFYPNSKSAATSAPPGGGFAGSSDGGFYGGFGGSSSGVYSGFGSGSGFGGFEDSLGIGGFRSGSGSTGFKGGFGGAGGSSFRGSRNGAAACEGRRGRGGGGSSGRGRGGGNSGSRSGGNSGSRGGGNSGSRGGGNNGSRGGGNSGSRGGGNNGSRGGGNRATSSGRGGGGSHGGAFSSGGASSGAPGRGRSSSGVRGGGRSWAPRQEAISHSSAPPPSSEDYRQRQWQSNRSEKAPSRGGTKRPAAPLSASAWLPPAKKRTEEPRKPFQVPDTAPENFKQLVECQHCSLCNASVNSIVTAEVHYNGKTHQRQLRDNGLPDGEYFSGVLFVLANTSADGKTQSASNLELPTGELDTRYCKLCDVTFTNSVQMYQHYAGKKHRTNAKDARKVANARLAENKVFYCDVCDVFTNTRESLDMHLTGSKHKASLEAKESGRIGEGAFAEHPEPALTDAHPSPQPATAEQEAEPPLMNPTLQQPEKYQGNSPPQRAAVPQRAGVGSTRSSAPAEWPFKCIHCIMIFDCQDALTAHVTSREHNEKVAASELG